MSMVAAYQEPFLLQVMVDDEPPLYFYDHSGISMSVTSFLGRTQHAGWDSGRVGWIVATPEAIQKEYGDLSPESYQKAEALMRGEVETYDLYLRGECYGFRLYENGEETDSCWGFFREIFRGAEGYCRPQRSAGNPPGYD